MYIYKYGGEADLRYRFIQEKNGRKLQKNNLGNCIGKQSRKLYREGTGNLGKMHRRN